jgi:hypothetical protein
MVERGVLEEVRRGGRTTRIFTISRSDGTTFPVTPTSKIQSELKFLKLKDQEIRSVDIGE